jgi:hypothetical protein
MVITKSYACGVIVDVEARDSSEFLRVRLTDHTVKFTATTQDHPELSPWEHRKLGIEGKEGEIRSRQISFLLDVEVMDQVVKDWLEIRAQILPIVER